MKVENFMWQSSQVYKARWKGTLVAVKVLSSQDALSKAEFARETAMLELLTQRHSHVVNYLDHFFGSDDQVVFDTHYIRTAYYFSKKQGYTYRGS
jgi:serine/threonine protein kinase